MTDEIAELIRAAWGHALVLFTSFAAMSAVKDRLRERELSFPLFTLGRNAMHMTERFRQTPGAVLLATGAAWEGFDFPGACVSLLVIPRLPFAYPDALKEKEREEYVLRHNYPELSEVLGYVYEKKKLWARTNSDDDFLDIRIGSGNIPLKAKLNAPREHFAMEEDVLKDELAELTDEQVVLENVPIMIRLLENTVLGAQGAPEDVIGFINTVVLQLAILFSYDEVKLVFLIEEKQLADMG